MAQTESVIPQEIGDVEHQEAKDRLQENYSAQGMANLVRQLYGIEEDGTFVLRKDELAEIAAQRVNNE